MHRYRTHTCGALGLAEAGVAVRLSGWCHRIRDHGGVLFIDLRDHYGLTQCVVDPDSPAFGQAEKLRSEFVVRVDGLVRRRPAGTENPEMPTGLIEVYVREIEVLGPAGDLPDRIEPGGRARLSRAVALACGQVLCAAAGAAAVQAASDDGGLRPLLPDRAVFSR
jgi:aspartyl-tRNA synthetase